MGCTLEPAFKLDNNTGPKPTSTSTFTSGFDAMPTNPDIWGELAIGALRVAPINPAVSGFEELAPAILVVDL